MSCDWMVLQLDRLVQLATHCNWEGSAIGRQLLGVVAKFSRLQDCQSAIFTPRPVHPVLNHLLSVHREASGGRPLAAARRTEEGSDSNSSNTKKTKILAYRVDGGKTKPFK